MHNNKTKIKTKVAATHITMPFFLCLKLLCFVKRIGSCMVVRRRCRIEVQAKLSHGKTTTKKIRIPSRNVFLCICARASLSSSFVANLNIHKQPKGA